MVFRPLSPRCTRRLRISAVWHRDESAPLVHDFVRIARTRHGTGLQPLDALELAALA